MYFLLTERKCLTASIDVIKEDSKYMAVIMTRYVSTQGTRLNLESKALNTGTNTSTRYISLLYTQWYLVFDLDMRYKDRAYIALLPKSISIVVVSTPNQQQAIFMPKRINITNGSVLTMNMSHPLLITLI